MKMLQRRHQCNSGSSVKSGTRRQSRPVQASAFARDCASSMETDAGASGRALLQLSDRKVKSGSPNSTGMRATGIGKREFKIKRILS